MLHLKIRSDECWILIVPFDQKDILDHIVLGKQKCINGLGLRF